MDFAEAKEAREILHGEDLFAQVQDLAARTMRILDQAEASSDQRTALWAIRESRGNLELLCKITVTAEAARREEPELEVVDREFIENMNLLLFGPDWKEKQAAEDAAIARGEPIKCRNCGQIYIKPLPAERSLRLLPSSEQEEDL